MCVLCKFILAAPLWPCALSCSSALRRGQALSSPYSSRGLKRGHSQYWNTRMRLWSWELFLRPFPGLVEGLLFLPAVYPVRMPGITVTQKVRESWRISWLLKWAGFAFNTNIDLCSKKEIFAGYSTSLWQRNTINRTEIEQKTPNPDVPTERVEVMRSEWGAAGYRAGGKQSINQGLSGGSSVESKRGET